MRILRADILNSTRLLRLMTSAVALAVVFCTTASAMPRPVSLSGSESSSPFEEEEERESQEESVEVYAAGRQTQRLRIERVSHRLGSIPSANCGENPRTHGPAFCVGHRFADGHSAPIVC